MREMIGSYELERVLGEGGMGIVYLAEHTVLRRRVAIKFLSRAVGALGSHAPQRFVDEACALGVIEDAGVVQIFDFGHHSDGRAYMVMEYVEGERLDRRVYRAGPLSVVQALRITRQLASSLRAAHAHGVLHRDLKPENIVLVPDPAVAGGVRTKLLDFGICKLLHGGASRTSTGIIVGTPAYMSPEQCRDQDELDPRSEVYSLTCVLFFLLTGRPPFTYASGGELLAAHLRERAPRASAFNHEVPPAVDAMIARCLAKSARDRLPTMDAMVEELSALLVGTTGEVPAESVDYVRATPMNTTLTFARPGTGATRGRRAPSEAMERSWGARVRLSLIALTALSVQPGQSLSMAAEGPLPLAALPVPLAMSSPPPIAMPPSAPPMLAPMYEADGELPPPIPPDGGAVPPDADLPPADAAPPPRDASPAPTPPTPPTPPLPPSDGGMPRPSPRTSPAPR